MKTQINQPIAIVTFLAIALFAGVSSARPMTGPPAGAPLNNASYPVNVGGNQQVKGGGLGVDSFIAQQNAGFDAITDIEGILMGFSSTNDSILSFGNATSAVDVTVSGTTYVQNGGLYSNQIVSPTLKPLCAEQNGDIIICP